MRVSLVISQLEPGLERAEVMLGRTSQEVMPGVTSGEVRLAARGSDAASQEACQVSGFSFLSVKQICLSGSSEPDFLGTRC